MPTYTKREIVFEDAEKIVYDVEGTDGDGDPFVGCETEFKAPSAERVLGDRIDANLDKLRDGIASFDTDSASLRWQTVKVALRVVLALARLTRGRTEVDG